VKAAANPGVRRVKISIVKEAVMKQLTVEATRATVDKRIVRIQS
jgi:hypothetical protein